MELEPELPVVEFNFGKLVGRSVLDPDCESYLRWMLGQGFNDSTNSVIQLALQYGNDEAAFLHALGAPNHA